VSNSKELLQLNQLVYCAMLCHCILNSLLGTGIWCVL